MPFGVLTSVCPVHLVFPFIFNQAGRHLLHAMKPYPGVVLEGFPETSSEIAHTPTICQGDKIYDELYILYYKYTKKFGIFN